MNSISQIDNLINFIETIDRFKGNATSDSIQSSLNLNQFENSFIENNNKQYEIIGVKSFEHFKHGKNILPLNEIDNKTIKEIKGKEYTAEFDEHHLMDDPIHTCITNDCPTLDIITETLLEHILNKINKFYDENKNYQDKNSIVAFYKPFHYAKREGGIYFITDKIINWVRRVYDLAKSDPIKYGNYSIDQLYLIFKVHIFYHEMYHHKIEAFATKIELLYRDNFYKKGFHCFYCNTYGTDYCLEEAFANVHGYYKTLDYFKNISGFDKNTIINILRDLIFRNQMPGYRLAYELTSKKESDAIKFENFYFEIIWKYAYNFNYGVDLPRVTESFWDLFTYNTDPLINTVNDVTYVKSTSSVNPQRMRSMI